MRFGDYSDYLTRRWAELGGEAATDAVRRRVGVFRESEMGWGNEATQQRAEQLAEEFKKAQMPIFIQIAGELHHVMGHRDVGLGKKNSGNRWELDGDDVASDILVLKDLDGGPEVQLVDCFSSMGGPETKPMWSEIDPNADRAWRLPPVPAGAVETGDGESGPTTVGSVVRIDLAPIVGELLKPLEAEVAALRKAVEELRGRPAGNAAELPEKLAFMSDHGTFLTAEQDGRVTARSDKPEAWQQWRPVKP